MNILSRYGAGRSGGSVIITARDRGIISNAQANTRRWHHAGILMLKVFGQYVSVSMLR